MNDCRCVEGLIENVWPDSSRKKCGMWLIEDVRHDSLKRCDVTHRRCVTLLIVHARNDYLRMQKCVTWFTPNVWHSVCDMTHSICDTTNSMWYMTQSMCDMTHWRCATWLTQDVWRDSSKIRDKTGCTRVEWLIENVWNYSLQICAWPIEDVWHTHQWRSSLTSRVAPHTHVCHTLVTWPTMGWLRLVGSLKLEVSFAEYSLYYKALFQKRPII